MDINHLITRKYADGSVECIFDPEGFGTGSQFRKQPDKRCPGINGEFLENPFAVAECDLQGFDFDAELPLSWVNYEDEETDEQRRLKEENNRRRSIRRTRQAVEALCRGNLWKYFVTLTLDPKKINPYDFDKCIEAVTNFFIKERRKYPGIKYVIVPEQHKSKAWHFHGLVAGCDWMPVLVDSGKRKRNQIIYNLSTEWTLGFSTVSTVRKQGACGTYLSKYITKCMNVPGGKKRYCASRNLTTIEDITERRNLSGLDFFTIIDSLYSVCDTFREVYVPVLDRHFYYFKTYGNPEVLCA